MEKGLLIECISELIRNILGCTEVILVMWGIMGFDLEKSHIKRTVSILLIAVVPILFSFVSLELSFENIIVLTINELAIFLFFEGQPKDKLVKSLFVYWGLIIIAGDINIVFYGISLFSDNGLLYKQLCIDLFNIIIILVIIKVLKNKSNYKSIIKSVKLIIYFLWILIFIIASAVMAIIDVRENTWNIQTLYFSNGIRILLSISIFMLFFLVAGLDIRKQQYKTENLLKDEYLKLSKEHFENLEWQVKETRKIKHDSIAHYTALKMFIENKDFDGANNYLNDMLNHLDKITSNSVRTGNDLIDAVMNNTLRRHPDVHVRCYGNVSKSTLSDYDLCTVFSNLFDNAVEATDKLKHTEKIVTIEIKFYEQFMLIGFTNPIEENVDVNNLGNYTTKENSYCHGMGIENVRNTLKNYNATIDFNVENNLFIVKIQVIEN